MADLTTLEAVKEYLGITHTNWDAVISSLITRMSQWVESYCNRVFLQATYTEYHDGLKNNGGQVFLYQFPVISITSLHDDTDRAYGAGTLIPAADYVTVDNTGVLKRTDGIDFAVGIQNIKAVYEAGYTETPPDLEQAVIELVVLKLSTRNTSGSGIKSERLGRWSVTYGAVTTVSTVDFGDIQASASVMDILNRYKTKKFVIV